MTEEREWLCGLEPALRRKLLKHLGPEEQDNLDYAWHLWARADQLPPRGDWAIWLICAGRGFGKTRAGAEWVRSLARASPDARIALVAASLVEARAVMVEGESGILACTPPAFRPLFEPSLRRLIWPNGAQAQLFSAGEPESLRGPQHSHAWCDEIAKWDNASGRAIRAWDNLQMGLRLGHDPRLLATTTPRAVPLMLRLMAEQETGSIALTTGSSYANAANLPSSFLSAMQRQYGGTALGAQELEGVLLREAEGALWSRALLENCRASMPDTPLTRIVVGVDPPASARGDECGIVVAGIWERADGHSVGHVLADASIPSASPERWARQVALTATSWQAERVVAEANQGGDMVASVLRAADCAMPLRLVHASRGKVARAEPVAALYEAGRVRHAECFPQLEDQLCALMAGGAYEGPTRSPDRADALVWALTELMLNNRPRPRATAL
ncbi:DNA-packaging protein [Altericroceibacterium endophyticum]|uniref:ATP-binding protein n=1 Tax=Altericroceibacterium endophyticum TaxID=1808508 RepID=A0A6I4T406_9SPHN|nr:terminase family protein [Altericroceibacterium endophyticum]MXO65488.1 ATP-binding protein [Altericroceibacterium endophyticum]